jgi:ubiquinone/menaquinone biosynthesis C-methylase UbiE
MKKDNDSKVLSRQRFDRLANEYVTSSTHARGPELQRLVDIVRPRPHWTILDVATGGGHTALAFASFSARVVALDIALTMLQAAREFIRSNAAENLCFVSADAENLPFEDSSFDLVTCRIAPHHFPDCDSFVRECERVLNTGGRLLVQDLVLPEDQATARYVNAFEKLRDPSHNQACPESRWRAMFQASGLTVEHAEQVVKRHDFGVWTARQRCAPDVIQKLITMVKQAPDSVSDWLQPRDFGTAQASFVNHHLIIAGRKIR